MDKKLQASTNEVENIKINRSPLQIAIATAEKAAFKQQVDRQRIIKKAKQQK